MTDGLQIQGLGVNVEGKEIVHEINLTVNPGEVHALMGPNGSGKSTLAHALMGHPKYVTTGSIFLDGVDIAKMTADERAKRGLFLSFQYPVEIHGVTVENFLRMAYNSTKGVKIGVLEFHTLLKEKMQELKIDPAFARRYLNEGFSGGEKKRMEVLQMSVLQPKYLILDETDSGLDVDSLKIVADGIKRLRGPDRGILLITHFNRILKFVEPDHVHIMTDGRIVRSGGKELAQQIDAHGYLQDVQDVTR